MEAANIIGSAIGVQHQGSANRPSPATNGLTIGLIVGRFMRGRTDKPMLIDSATIETLLGYEPSNPFYQAVQGALDTGISSVWVMRVGGDWRKLPDMVSVSNIDAVSVVTALGDAVLGGDKLISAPDAEIGVVTILNDAFLGGDKVTATPDAEIDVVATLGDAFFSEDKVTESKPESVGLSSFVGGAIVFSQEFVVANGVGDRGELVFVIHDAVIESYEG